MAVQRLSRLGGRRVNAVVALVGVIVAAALVVLAVELSDTQSGARQTLASRFADRAQVVSALIQAELSSVTSSTKATPAYNSPVVTDRALDRAAAQGGLAYLAVLDRTGQVVAASQRFTSSALQQVRGSRALTRVLAGAPVFASDAEAGGVVDLVVPLTSAAGPRVLIGGIPAPALTAFLGTYLERLPTEHGVAYVVDSRDDIIGASRAAAAISRRLAEPSLVRSLARGTAGPYGDAGYFVSTAIPDTTWRVVLTTTRTTLFSSVGGSRKWLPWAIYIAFAIMTLGCLALLRGLLARSAALSDANAQLETSNARLYSTNALLRRAAELSRSNAELEQFASIASHDLQEPLRKVQTFAAQLNATERERLSDQGQDFLRRMSDAAGRMRSLIDDLLMFSRVSTQARPFVEVSLADVLAQVLADLEVTVQEAGAQVTVGRLPTVEADPLQMRQLMQNLVGNALKFRRDGVVCKVHVSGTVVDHIAELTVGDNGIGFDDQYATRIFRAFERLHGMNAYPGTGIGLALCRKIVERHHGTITATSEPGNGARFTVRLPVQQPMDGPAEQFEIPESIDEVVHAHV